MITIPGAPIALKRHRHTRQGLTYNSQSQEMEDVYHLVRSQLPPGMYFSSLPSTPIKVTFTFFMPIPKSYKKTKTGDPHYKKPDLTNLIKFPEDALNGVLWNDDSNIYSINASKVYSDNPRTEINIDYI